DKLVTGVQTCALPISGGGAHSGRALEGGEQDLLLEADVPAEAERELGPGGAGGGDVTFGQGGEGLLLDALEAVVVPAQGLVHARSEERRVGKECRGRW